MKDHRQYAHRPTLFFDISSCAENLIYMSKFFFGALLNFTGVFMLFSPVAAQDSLRVNVANLSQDVNLLEQSLKTMRLEIEELRRENGYVPDAVAFCSSGHSRDA